jgi:hypothetical protein
VVDTTPPVVTITSSPGPLTGSATAQFQLAATDSTPGGSLTDCDQCTFQCALDSDVLRPCGQSVFLSNLGTPNLATTHVFRATAVDLAGNQAVLPAVYTWTVDQRAPIISLLSGPSDSDNAMSGSIVFAARIDQTSEDCTNCTAYCALDGQSPVYCSIDPSGLDKEGLGNARSSKASLALLSYANLSAGLHSARVTVTKPLGSTAEFVHSWVIDLTNPVINIILPDNPVRQNPFLLAIAFSEACRGFTCVSMTSCEIGVNGPALAEVASFSQRGELLYEMNVTAISDGLIGIRVPGGVCHDAAGNPSSPFNASVYFQARAPEAVLTTKQSPFRLVVNGVASLHWATNEAPVWFVVNFSREVTGFNTSGILVLGGKVQSLFSVVEEPPTGLPQSGLQISGATPSIVPSLVTLGASEKAGPSSTFTFQVWPSAPGNISVRILAYSCTDAVGSFNTESETLTVLFDTVAPTVTLSLSRLSAFHSALSSQLEAVAILVQFSEQVVVRPNSPKDPNPVDVALFGPSQVSTSGCNVTEVVPQSDGLSYLVTLTKEYFTEGRVWVMQGAVTDLAGNPSAASNVLVLSPGESMSRGYALKN